MIPVGLLAGNDFIPSAFNNTTLASTAIWKGIGNSGSSFIVAGRTPSNGFINRSTNNGATWSAITDFNREFGSVAYGNSRYVLSFYGDASGGSTNFINYSTDDGLTFFDVSAGTNVVSSVIYDGTRFLGYNYVLTTDRRITYSTNATSWTQSGILSQNVGSQGRLTQLGTIFILLPINNSTSVGAVCTSDPTVNTNWSNMTAPSQTLRYTVSGNSIFLCGPGSSATYYTSANGTSWTTRTLPATSTGDIGFTNEYFWFKAVTTNVVYYSPDGINWTSTGLSSAQPSVTSVWGGNGSTLIQVGSAAGSATNLGSYSS